MTITDVALELINPNPWQTRDHEDTEQVAEVAASIAKVGLLQNPVGRMVGQKVQLAFGHTRLRAYEKLFEQIGEPYGSMPVDVRELTDEEMFELAVRENVERKDLTPIEEARAMARYRDDFHKTSEEIGELFHLSGPAVRNKMRLLELPAAVQTQVEGGQIGEGTARKLLAVQRLAPERIETLATNLVKGGFDTPERISDEIRNVLQEESFCIVGAWEAKRGGDDDDPDGKVRAGKGLWPLGWKAAVEKPTAEKLLKLLPERFQPTDVLNIEDAVPSEDKAVAEIIEALASGTDVDGVVKLYGLSADAAAWIRQFVAPPPCSACEFHQVLDGAHYCGIKACWSQKRQAWLEAETRKVSKRLGIPVYDSSADGKDTIAAPSEYVGDSSGQRLHSSWQKMLDAKDASLRVRGKAPAYSKEPGTGSYVVELVRVGKAAAEAKKRKASSSSSGQFDREAYDRRREAQQKREQASRRLIEQTAPILAEALVNGESVAGLEMIWDTFRQYGDRKLPEKKALRVAVLRERIAASVLAHTTGYSVQEKGPKTTAKHLQGVATALGVKLPKAWDEMAADLEASVSTETAEGKKAA